ncbi:MAG: hypothetical protein J2O49_01030 [Sciscionella sp.]|nr:hypothetical protein [Sciscionella sp.]
MRISTLAGVFAVTVVMTACGPRPPSVSSARPSQPSQSATVTATSGCPRTAPTDTDIATGPASTMVPDTPNTAVVCRYAGLNDRRPAHQLVRTGHVDGDGLRQLVEALNAATPGMTGTIHCTLEYGSVDLVRFDYPHRAAVDVLVTMSGCSTASNGSRRVMFAGQNADDGTSVYRLLTAAAGTHGPPAPAASPPS